MRSKKAVKATAFLYEGCPERALWSLLAEGFETHRNAGRSDIVPTDHQRCRLRYRERFIWVSAEWRRRRTRFDG
jgi:hypothetical protein